MRQLKILALHFIFKIFLMSILSTTKNFENVLKNVMVFLKIWIEVFLQLRYDKKLEVAILRGIIKSLKDIWWLQNNLNTKS